MNAQMNGTRLGQALATNESLNNDATVEGITNLVDKVAPLLQGGRFHNVVDVLSAVSDMVDLADDALVQKLTRNFEVFSAAAFNLNNAFTWAVEQAGQQKDLPGLWGTLRQFNRSEDARRGLAVAVAFLTLLGKQARYAGMEMPED